MQRPRLKRTTQRMEAPNGDLYLLRPSAGADIHIEDPDREGRRLLAALDGTRTEEELIEEFGPDEVGDLLAQFEELGVVEDAADDDGIPEAVVERFDRQLRYFSDITTGPTAAECQERLASARIAVLGVGGLGGWVGAEPGLLRDRRDAAARLRPGRAEQPQPPGPLLGGRHRPLQGRGGGGATGRVQLAR